MLKQRVITAIILFGVFVATLAAPGPWPLIILLTLLSACALWEWLRLSLGKTYRLLPVVLATILAALLFAVASQWLSDQPQYWSIYLKQLIMLWLVPLVSIFWVLGATAMVLQGQSEKRRHGFLLSLFGVLAVIALWVALAVMFLTYGAWFLISLMALIWVADTAAYFSGKAFGKHKLAPRVSPGKTWEGAVGGVLAATAWVALSAMWPGSFAAILLQHWPWWAVLIIAILLASISIVGDLFESLLKRRAQVKDSSGLLPGHGGVYDRIDALLPVAPMALLLTVGASF